MSPDSPLGDRPDPVEQVRRLLDGPDTKAALVKAKAVHKDVRTAQSKELLVEAYTRRVAALRQQGLNAEAYQLEQLLEERYGKLSVERAAPASRPGGELASLVAPLADPALAAEQRRAIEALLVQRLTDPADLARCEALPADHPLRAGARLVSEAFAVVTSGPVAEGAPALPDAPRRSPLASWALLIRSLGCYYRRQDEACLRFLDAIDPVSPAARLATRIRAMLTAAGRPTGGGDAHQLVARVCRSGEPLRPHLEGVEQALDDGSDKRLTRSLRGAVEACTRSRPDRLDWLRTRLEVRLLSCGVPLELFRSALSGCTRRDAAYWRLRARTEEFRSPPSRVCLLWDQFRRQGTREGWFPATGPEVAAIHLRMAALVVQGGDHHRLPPAARLGETVRELRLAYKDQATEAQRVAWDGSEGRIEAKVLDPEHQFACAVAADPHAGGYRAWLAHARSISDKAAEQVAVAWRDALPGDPEPLLFLTESCEARDAFSKALRFLAEAEKRDALNPTVQRARFRLTKSIALRHIAKRNHRLLEQDLAALEALPQAPTPDRAAFVSALRLAAHLAGARHADAARVACEISGQLASDAAAVIVSGSVCRACGCELGPILSPSRLLAALSAPELAEAVARACRLLCDVDVPAYLPPAWETVLAEGCKATAARIAPAGLRALASAALGCRMEKLAYAASGAGLTHEGPLQAAFLVQRATSLRVAHPARAVTALRAAVALAQRHRDSRAQDRAVELLRQLVNVEHSSSAARDWISMAPADLAAALDVERRSLDFPAVKDRGSLTLPGMMFCSSCGTFHPDAGGQARLPFSVEEEDDGDETDFDYDEGRTFAEFLFGLGKKLGASRKGERR